MVPALASGVTKRFTAFPMVVLAHLRLLGGQHLHKPLPVAFLFQRFENLLLRLGHCTSNAMAFALVLANVDTGTGRFGHETSLCYGLSVMWLHRAVMSNAKGSQIKDF